jgi:hypothetical protein
MLAAGNFPKRVAGRMADFFAVHAPWQRRLWNVSGALALAEIVEASEAVRDRALGQASLDWFRSSLGSRIGKDPGFGDGTQRAAIRDALKGKIAAGGENHRVLQQLEQDVGEHYLERWAVALEVENHGQQPERVARALASHLLDSGVSQDHLHRWLTYLRDHDGNVHDAASIARAGQKLLDSSLKRFRILVVFENGFPPSVSPPEEHLTRDEATNWLEERGLSPLVGELIFRGALLLKVRSRDVESAVEQVADAIDALSARAAVGARHDLRVHAYCFVAGHKDRRYQLRRPRRVDIRALARQDRLSDDLYAAASDPIFSALQLVAQLDRASPESAVSGGWSAIESLLTAPGDEDGNVMAADRLAALVACAWPRAELTTLAWNRVNAVDDEFSEELRAADTNAVRAEMIAQKISAGDWLQLTDPSDETAVRRMGQLLKKPAEVLRDVEDHAVVALRRFYRQRNLVVHGGRTGAVALRPSLRTVAPLVGAGMDRIVHAHLESRTHPLDLAARARFELARAGSSDAPALTALLG